MVNKNLKDYLLEFFIGQIFLIPFIIFVLLIANYCHSQQGGIGIGFPPTPHRHTSVADGGLLNGDISIGSTGAAGQWTHTYGGNWNYPLWISKRYSSDYNFGKFFEYGLYGDTFNFAGSATLPVLNTKVAYGQMFWKTTGNIAYTDVSNTLAGSNHAYWVHYGAVPHLWHGQGGNQFCANTNLTYGCPSLLTNSELEVVSRGTDLLNFRKIDGTTTAYIDPYTGEGHFTSITGLSWTGLPTASTTTAGIVQLSNSYVGTSQTLATTEKALYDGLATKESILTFNAPLTRLLNDISISSSGATSDGYLKQADWVNFNTAYGWGNHAGLYDILGTAASLVGTHESSYDHTQYAKLAGRSGGQTLQGGTAASENLILESTAHATKGQIIIKDSVSISTNTVLNYGAKINIYESAGGANTAALIHLAPNIGTGQAVFLAEGGTALSSKNLGYIKFRPRGGAGSSSNTIDLGFYGADDLVSLTAGGNLGINIVNPTHKVQVFNGDIYNSGSGAGFATTGNITAAEVITSTITYQDGLKQTISYLPVAALNTTTSPIAINSTTDIAIATATITLNGSRPLSIKGTCQINTTFTAVYTISLYDGGSLLRSQLMNLTANDDEPMYIYYHYLSSPSGSKTYYLKMKSDSTSGTQQCTLSELYVKEG